MTKKTTSAAALVGDWMTRKVVTVMADDTIQDTVNLMLEHDLTTVPVVDIRAQCLGVISRNDLTELYAEEDSQLSNFIDNGQLSLAWLGRTLDTCEVQHVKELMTHDVCTISADQSLAEASQILVEKGIHHLPVVDENQQLVGMLSTLDIVRSVAQN